MVRDENINLRILQEIHIADGKQLPKILRFEIAAAAVCIRKYGIATFVKMPSMRTY